MALLIERIAELRKEIAAIQSASRLASMSIPYQDREAMRQWRAERLQEIMDGLRSLIDRKEQGPP